MVELENRLLSELSESHVMAGSRCRVLVIEDDPETGEQLVQSLLANGYQVDLADQRRDGLSRDPRITS
jgi:ActR/RegA family two-component response regulator